MILQTLRRIDRITVLPATTKMRFLVFALFAFIPAILADAPSGVDASIQQMIKEGHDKIQKALDDVKTQMGVSKNPTGDEIVKLLKDKNEKLGEELKKMRAKVEEQIKNNPDASAALKSITDKLKEAQEKLKKENPEISKNAEKLGDSIKSTWDSITGEVEKSWKEFNKKGGKHEEVENVFKNIVDAGVKAANELKDGVEKAINKKP
ncbi:hypothetical protein GE061_008363 [Apolygus lucorum]|uniref:Uncharacterized protein n=1 Tax=Apolygus lucorum TaxID=248454 RepID=A0A8S9WR34_APOLU|nr:hypothetical protein GE061_008363 [Apolygus lucorum]